ncbi:MAG TPA: MFS transporter [Hyphomicrobiaceae bacterium]|nr:MFS transporter [Hyphomicrobiaceae bacterium]
MTSREPQSGTSHWSRSQRKVLALAFATAVVGWGFSVYGPAVLLGMLKDTAGWSLAGISAAISLHYLVGALLVMWLPEVHARIGLVSSIRIGIVAATIGLIAWSAAWSVYAMLPAAVLTGVGWALLGAATVNALVAPSFDRDRPKALALAFNGATLAGVIFTPLLVAANSALGQIRGYAIVALTASIVLLGLVVMLGSDLSSRDPTHSPPSMPPRLTIGELMSERRFVSLAIATCLGVFAQIGILTHLFARLVQPLGATGASLAVSMASIGVVVGRSLFAEAFQRSDRRLVGVAGFLLQIPGALALAFGSSTPVLAAGALVLGLAAGPVSSLGAVVAQSEFEARDVPRVVALVTSINQIGLAGAPLAVGLIAEVAGGYLTSYCALAAVMALGALSLLIGRESKACSGAA